jgi:hypothetical protein
MSGSIVIGMDAAGRTRQGITHAQPCATRDSAQINPTCVSGKTHPHGIAGVRELVTVRIATLGAGERIVATIRCSKHLNSPASFQSASVCGRGGADTGGLRGPILPAFRLRFNSFRPLKASGSLSSLVKCFQQPTSGLSYRFRSFSCAVFHDRNTSTESEPQSWKPQPQIRMASKCLM